MPNRESDLTKLLQDAFDADVRGLQQWIRLELGKQIHDELPSNASLVHLAFETTVAIGRHGRATPALFERLCELRPHMAMRIREVATLWGVALNAVGAAPIATPHALTQPVPDAEHSGGQAPLTEPAHQAEPTTGLTSNPPRALDDEWFNSQFKVAQKGADAIGVKAYMELRLGLHEPINKSQIDLMASARKSEIKTFGWPIALILDRDEYKPRPYADGIRAEVSMKSDLLSGRQSYDYWGLRFNGDFFLLQNLFEDQRTEKAIFFNTRIVRVTEALLFAANLYTNLGVALDARLSVRVAHRGLAGRQLSSSNPNRRVHPHRTLEDTSQVETVVIIGKIRELLVENVQRLTEPLFMLFDFARFVPEVYQDIVRRFEKGEVT